MKTGVIDRFEKGVEGDFAIIELDDREVLIVDKSLVPSSLREGDRVALDDENRLI